jgi:heme/copper-type cytochrome/quinol oxidase subunit 2
MTFRFTDVVFWLAAASCAVGHVAILHSIVSTPLVSGVRSSENPEDRRAEQRRRAIEIVWAVIPGIALAFVLIFTWRAMHYPHVHLTHGSGESIATGRQ